MGRRSRGLLFSCAGNVARRCQADLTRAHFAGGRYGQKASGFPLEDFGRRLIALVRPLDICPNRPRRYLGG
jgi:hypothetical protein